MVIIQQDNFVDTDGTVVNLHDPAIGGWFWPADPGNMLPEIHGNHLTGSTNYHRADLAPPQLESHVMADDRGLMTNYDIHATIYVASLTGEIGLTYWDNDPYGFHRVVYKAASGDWHIDRNDAAYDGDDQPVTTVLDSYAQALTVGQSVQVTVQVRDTGATVLLGGTAHLSTTDMTYFPGSTYTITGVGGATGRVDTGIWLYGGSATTGLQFSHYELDSIPNAVAQGATATFPISFSVCPAGGAFPNWDIQDPGGTVIGSMASPGGWGVTAPDATHLTVTSPSSAPVASGYRVRYNPDADFDCVATDFDVTPASGGDGGGGGGGGTPPPRRRRVCGC